MMKTIKTPTTKYGFKKSEYVYKIEYYTPI